MHSAFYPDGLPSTLQLEDEIVFSQLKSTSFCDEILLCTEILLWDTVVQNNILMKETQL